MKVSRCQFLGERETKESVEFTWTICYGDRINIGEIHVGPDQTFAHHTLNVLSVELLCDRWIYAPHTSGKNHRKSLKLM